MKVPATDLGKQHASLRPKLEEAFGKVLEKSAFVLGEFVERFEKEFAGYCDARYAVGVNSGTSALYVAMRACGVVSGDEVITSPFTFAANVEAILLAGAIPRFADVDPETLNLAPEKLEEVFSEKTRAVMPIHLYGHPADLDPIIGVSREHGVAVIEDAAQANGARYKGKRVGSICDVGCFSFYPAKTLGAFGEGGMVIANDEEIARKARLIRHHGDTSRYEHSLLGFNFRMEGLQGAILSVKLEHLDGWVQRRRELARAYREKLDGLPITLPVERSHAYHCYNYYTIRTPERDALQQWLADHDVESAVNYPITLHLQRVCRELGYEEGDFPISEKAAREVLSLPIFPEMTDEQLNYVAEVTREFFG